MFTLVPIIIISGFVLVFGFIIFTLIKNGIQWNKNNNSPVLTVMAKIVAKRETVQHHHGNNLNDMHHHTSYTDYTYFATFEVESGDRIELRVPNKEYGILIYGDSGKLTFQGTRYKEFIRER